ncbi:DUF3566 domain-containing protein [Corynebacterium lubricantis]|uniref:DUF3566 domain-containing protein n=1 Tax=Corynebacterium lubricantis TaxID=541095 RepID=UPI00036FA57C|nr:DUF3566 domain-containing protein [Corynebacterium lubricantis]
MAAREVELRKISPASAFKVGLILGLIGLVIWLIAVTILYVGMDAAGVVDQVNSLIGGVGGEQAVGFGLAFMSALLMGAIGTILVAVLAPLTAVIYNLVADIMGGLRVTLDDKKK